MRQISLPKILYIFQRHKDIVYKDKDELLKTKMNYQRQRCPKDVPKTKALREDVKDGDSKDKDAKDKLDVFLMYTAPYRSNRPSFIFQEIFTISRPFVPSPP